MAPEKLNIRVETHNGDAPSNYPGGTGHRTGYYAGTGQNRVYLRLGTTVIQPCPEAPPPPSFNSIRMVKNSYGDCPHCDAYGEHPKQWVLFQEGREHVHVCSGCHQHLRPWKPPARLH